jgi:hypothetical protein
MRKLGIIAVLLLASAPLYAQDEVARKQAVEVAARVPLEKATKGAPYSAETIVENSQTFVDGNRINRKTTGRVYRDSEGRTRREEDRDFSATTSNGPVAGRMTSISIIDPVAGFSYSLDPEKKIAWRTPIGGANAIMGKLEASQVEARRELEERLKAVDEQRMKTQSPEGPRARGSAVAEEKERAAGAGAGPVMMRRGGPGDDRRAGPLEHKTIEGLNVEGRKNTSIIPAGQIGNEQPITITSEEWRSPELNVLVLTRHSDPRMGESSYRLVNIIRAEPDRSLFMVPADYTVKETGIKKMLEESRKQ